MEKTPMQQAFGLINQIYQPLGYLGVHNSPDVMWQYSKERAKEQVEQIKKEVPMYIGNLNPRWKFWDDVSKEIEKQ